MSTEIVLQNVRELIDSIDTFLLDCDGVLWLNQNVIPHIPQTLSWLRSLGKNLIFITNNSMRSRASYQEFMQKMQIQSSPDEIWCSSFAAALYLKSLNFRKKAYVVGSKGITDELDLAKIPHNNVDEHCEPIESISDICDYQFDPSIGAIVVGMDLKINYRKLSYSLLHLKKNPDCLLIATNKDHIFPTAENFIPGTGTIVKAIEHCSDRSSFVVGKPSPWLLDQIIEMHKFDRSKTLMVGDKLSTDILFGNNGNIKTLLVLTGVTSREMLLNQNSSDKNLVPDFFCASLPYLKDVYEQNIAQNTHHLHK